MNNNLEKFNYNVIVANMYETYNFLNKILEKKFSKRILIDNYRKILSLMSPVIPHVINECLENNKLEISQKWPSLDRKYLEEKIVSIVVQFDGKKRGVIQAEKEASEKTVMELVRKEDKISKNLENKKVSKIFFVKNKLINIVLND
tara:strand:- start:116 stop:553 length:438 start_codon:yes stop_codon:yes gene_type:complete